MALVEHAGAVGRGQHQLETVGDLIQTIFDGDACHVGSSKRWDQRMLSARNVSLRAISCDENFSR